MTQLDTWLNRATRRLSAESAAQVRAEIAEHYEAALQAAMASGASFEEASRSSLAALGNAGTANCQYRRVLLTSAEASLLRQGEREAKSICSRPWIKVLLFGAPALALWTSAALFLRGSYEFARTLLACGVTMLIIFGVPFLPIYTASRARIFRWVKWATLAVTFTIVFGKHALDWSWLLACSVWPFSGSNGRAPPSVANFRSLAGPDTCIGRRSPRPTHERRRLQDEDFCFLFRNLLTWKFNRPQI